MRTLLIHATLLACFAASAMAQQEGTSATSITVDSPVSKAPSSDRDRWSFEKLSISTSRTVLPLSQKESSVYLVKKSGRWEISRTDQFDPQIEDQERLIFQDEKVRIGFDAACDGGDTDRKDTTKCMCLKGLTQKSRKNDGYSLCTTSLRKTAISAVSIVATGIGSVFTVLGGSTLVPYQVDTDSVMSAIKEAGVIEMLNKKYYEQYKFEFDRISDSFRAGVFISKYEREKYDPDQLIPTAREKEKMLFAEERLRKQIQDEQKEVIRQQEAKERDRRLAEEAKERSKRMKEEAELTAIKAKRRESFRNSLKVGDDTFCGPVIEVKQPMIKIAVRVQLPGYNSEQWLKASEVFMPDEGCQNVNGRLHPMTH